MGTRIEYVDEAWNPVIGCSKCSPGCENCYAETMAARLWRMGRGDYGSVLDIENYKWNGKVLCRKGFLDKPLHWRKSRRILVPSMGDLFHEKVPFEFIVKVFWVAQKCPQHTFLFLTKRIKRASEFYKWCYPLEVAKMWGQLPNVHLGATICTQKEADEKIPILLQIPAAYRWISIEPMLEEIKFVDDKLFYERESGEDSPVACAPCYCGKHWQNGTLFGLRIGCLDGAVIGCESGPKRRPCKLEWIKSIVQQCKAASVGCYVKQIPWPKLDYKALERILLPMNFAKREDLWPVIDNLCEEYGSYVEHDIKKFPESLRVRDEI